MRLRRLDLDRYGHFTGRSLDFGPPPQDGPDLHVVFGPNEAGKSTLLSAWLDLLYGIPDRTPLNFLHPYPSLRIAGALETPSGTLEIARIKARTGGLLDANGAALPETVLAAALGGIDRDAYRAMFSLDDDTIEAGGESILASRGDLGQLLFQASAGLPALSARIDALRRAADLFHRPNARSGTLHNLRQRLEETETRRAALDVAAGDWARLIAVLTEAEQASDRADIARRAEEAQLSALDRQAAALPMARRLMALRDRLAAEPALPPPPPGWGDEAASLAARATEIAALSAELADRAARLAEERTRLPQDPATLAMAPQLQAAAALRSAHDESGTDLPARRAERDGAAGAVAVARARLGSPDGPVAAVLLPAPRRAALRRLTETASGLLSALTAARAEAARADEAAAEAQAHADTAAVPDAAPDAAVARLVAAWRAADPLARDRAARLAATAAASAAAAALAPLSPWTGTPDDLARLSLPDGPALDALAARLEATHRAAADARARVATLAADQARDFARLQARAAADQITPADLAAARARRETAWAAHRAALTPGTAAAFESAMRADDALMADRARAGAAEAAAAQLAEDIALRRIAAEHAEAQARASATALQAAEADLAAACAAISPALPPGVAALRAWCARRAQALEAIAAHRDATAAAEAAARDLAQMAAALAAALGRAPDHPPVALLAEAEARLDAVERRAALRDALARSRTEADRRARALAAAETAWADWQGARDALLAGTWLAGHPAADPAALPDTLDSLDALDRAETLRQGLADRVAKMEANRDAFRAAATALASSAGLPADDPVAAFAMLDARLRAAEAARTDDSRVAAELAQTQARADALTDEARRIIRRVAEMGTGYGATTPDALAAALRAADTQATLQAEAATLAQDLAALAGADADAAALAAVDPDALAAARAAAQDRAEAARDAAQSAFAALAAARRAVDAVGGDDAAARLDQERQTLLTEIAAGARRHLARRLGLIAAETALAAYREAHRSDMMDRASAAFRRITLGAYRGLAAQPDREREVLVAIPAQGGSKAAADLSKGTRMQLYLALRVAGYHVMAAQRPPVPLIADDIMETFDDDRAAASFAVLAETARAGQVIYLTHHAHLVEIAERVCPGLRVHRLAGGGVVGDDGLEPPTFSV